MWSFRGILGFLGIREIKQDIAIPCKFTLDGSSVCVLRVHWLGLNKTLNYEACIEFEPDFFICSNSIELVKDCLQIISLLIFTEFKQMN